MLQNNLHHPLAEPDSTVRLKDKHIAQVSECGAVGDHPRKPDLRADGVVVQTEAKRVADSTSHGLARDPRAPIRSREICMNRADVQTIGVRRNGV